VLSLQVLAELKEYLQAHWQDTEILTVQFPTLGVNSVSDVGVSGNTLIVTISRSFQNGSPQDVIVKEVALVFNAIIPPRATTNATLARDILATPFTATVGSAFTVYYRLSVAIS
jgi:hypothetical protein